MTTISASAWSQLDKDGIRLAIEEAKKGYDEGGIPIGSVILLPKDLTASPHSEGGKERYEILGKGHNQRIQKGSAVLHGEMDALEDAGRLKAAIYRKATIYTTLSPCSMCTGAILLFKIPRVVIGENSSFMGGEELLRSHGVQVTVLDSPECKELMDRFIRERPEDWYEDISEED